MRKISLRLSIAFLTVVSLASVVSAASLRTTVTPMDNGRALVNPDMGWTMHFYSNSPNKYGTKLEPSDTLDYFPGVSTVYLRLPWAMVEPEEGKFNWAVLDTPAQRWISKGKRVAFRITCSENWTKFAIPEWVKNAGAKGTFYTFGKGPSADGCWDPDFGDPIFLEKLENFLKAMSARYNGNPNVDFIDIGTYGLWGEGHTFMSSRVPDDQGEKILRKHIDLHVKYFPDTLLCISDDAAGHDKPGKHFPIMDYALSKGVSMRDDSILVQPSGWYHAEMAQEFWPKLPVILEHEHYQSSKDRGSWGDGSRLLTSVEEYHASYMSIHWWPQEFLDANKAVVDKINKRLGYRLQLKSISWPDSVRIKDPFSVTSKWANAGVAPCYPGGCMALTLKDSKSGIVSVLVDESLNMRDLQVAAPGEAPVKSTTSQFTIGAFGPTTKAGTYDVYVSVGKRDGTPVIELPLNGDDGQRRYKLGTITLTGGK